MSASQPCAAPTIRQVLFQPLPSIARLARDLQIDQYPGDRCQDARAGHLAPELRWRVCGLQNVDEDTGIRSSGHMRKNKSNDLNESSEVELQKGNKKFLVRRTPNLQPRG